MNLACLFFGHSWSSGDYLEVTLNSIMLGVDIPSRRGTGFVVRRKCKVCKKFQYIFATRNGTRELEQMYAEGLFRKGAEEVDDKQNEQISQQVMEG